MRRPVRPAAPQPAPAAIGEPERPCAAEETTRALADERQEPGGVQLGEQIALELDERLVEPEPIRLEGGESRALKRDRREIGEGLREVDVGGREVSDGVATRHQHAEHPRVREERNTERRVVAFTLDEGAAQGRQLDGRIVEHIPRPDRAALGDRGHRHAFAPMPGQQLTAPADQPA